MLKKRLLSFFQALQLFLQITEPVQKYYRSKLLLTLLRQVYYICNVREPDQTWLQVRELTVSCLKLLLTGCTPVEVQPILEDIKKECYHYPAASKVVSFLEETFPHLSPDREEDSQKG